nr:Protein OS-9 [Exophiala xenobiotica]
MRNLRVLYVVALITQCLASESAFSVNDDLFAFPQYTVEFSDSYILEADALAYLNNGQSGTPRGHGELSPKLNHKSYDPAIEGDSDSDLPGSYERILLEGYPHLCFIPEAKPNLVENATKGAEPSASATDREKELDRAVSRGSELLQDMASNQCLYYSTGWWTYAFCYNAQVTQFHALPPGTNGRVWPPQEDPTTPSYILGTFADVQKDKKTSSQQSQSPSQDGTLSTEVRTQAETNYLVQRLEGGTPCDLTGNNRKVEVQFHCNPQLTDRIGWIKETATCAYLMIIYTPRLCNDVAFQPPRESRAHPISCSEIIQADDVSAWEARINDGQSSNSQTLDQAKSQQITLGNIEVGAMKHVGREGKRLERGRIVLTQDEKAETVIMQKNGQISSLSAAELKKLDLSPEDVESFRKELQKLAGTKDWKIERLDDVNGHIQLRGVVATEDDDADADGGDGDGETTKTAKPTGQKDEEAGSQEEYKEEL